MYHFLFTFLVIIFTSSIAEPLPDDKTQQTIYKICKQITDTKFCSEVFLKNLVTSSPSNKDLMNITVIEAEKFSAKTYFFISTLLRNGGDERPDLQMCAEAYAIVNMAFMKAVSFFNQGLYSKIFNLEEKVSTGVEICKTDFNVPNYKINPMIEINRETLIFMAMEKIVARMVSS